jgi:hypothetical protein
MEDAFTQVLRRRVAKLEREMATAEPHDLVAVIEAELEGLAARFGRAACGWNG